MIFFRLYENFERTCNCGKSKGMYLDIINAKYSGPCIPLGFINESFLQAIKYQPEEGLGRRFAAFIIPKQCDTFIKED